MEDVSNDTTFALIDVKLTGMVAEVESGGLVLNHLVFCAGAARELSE